MARGKGRLAEAGFVRVGPERTRHYRAPDGEEVSYREAFRRARGESLEAAVKNPAKFNAEFRIAERVRFLAREGLLAETTAVSRTDERRIARSTLRELTKGHYGPSTREKRPDDVYAKVLSVLQAEPTVTPQPNEAGTSIEARVAAERARINAPTGDKANLLVALGFRDPDADYDVGETPK